MSSTSSSRLAVEHPMVAHELHHYIQESLALDEGWALIPSDEGVLFPEDGNPVSPIPTVAGAIGCSKGSRTATQQACRKGFRAVYRRAPRLFDELRLAHAEGTYVRLLARLARVDVLVIDDFAIAPVTDFERRHLLELLDDRHDTRSTIVTSQLAPADWHDYLADPTLADAICDRIVHQAHRLVLTGPSRRKGSPPSSNRIPQRRFAPITVRRSERSRSTIWVITLTGMRNEASSRLDRCRLGLAEGVQGANVAPPHGRPPHPRPRGHRGG